MGTLNTYPPPVGAHCEANPNLFMGTAHVRCWGKLRRCPNRGCLTAYTTLHICRCGTPTHDLGERKEAA